jgi:hypothetical protein
MLTATTVESCIATTTPLAKLDVIDRDPAAPCD